MLTTHDRKPSKDGLLLSAVRGWLSRKATSRDPAPLRDLLIAEFMISARLATVVTSMATARRSGQTLKLLGAYHAYLPTQPYVFQAGCATATREAVGHELIASLQEYYARLAFVSSVTGLPSDQWQSGGAPSESEWRDIENSWCWVCTLATVVVHHINDQSADTDARRSAQLKRVMGLLRAAKDGNQPCVTADGMVIVPGWLDRRHQERHHLGWPVCLEVSGTREDATLRDISISGMGLSDCGPHAVGREVVVHLRSGRHLAGHVRWASANYMGVAFSTPLASTDPLLGAQRDGLSA